MILSKLKPWSEIMSYLHGEESVFLVACNGCAAASGSGGPAQLAAVQERLESEGKRLTGAVSVDFLCQKALVKLCFRAREKAIAAADCLLVLACGIGVQAVAATVDRPCHPACNTMSLGGIRGKWPGRERCWECGDCVLHFTGGICPLTTCAKGLLNGPCGGATSGKCEADRSRACGWELIYHRLRRLGRLENLKVFIPPKDYSKMLPGADLRSTVFYSLDQPERQ